mgnify:CR=1 FL=1
MQLTIVLPIHCSRQAKNSLIETIRQYTGSYNRCCEAGWEMKRINGVDLHHETYYKEKDYTDLPAQLICSARAKATESLKSARTKLRKGEKASLPRCRTHQSIRYDANSCTIWFDRKEATLSTVKGRVKVRLTIPKYYENRLGWKVCSADLCVHRDKRPYLHVVVQWDEPTPEITQYCGIDFGVCRPAVTSDNQFYGERSWTRTSNKIYKLREALKAKGTDSAKRHLKRLGSRENRFRRDCDHVVSKRLVQQHPQGTCFVVEDLTGINRRVKVRREQRHVRHSWSFARLKFFLEYKARLRGGALVSVDPRYTSRKCSVCGHISKKNRLAQSDFCCEACGYQLNADLNAARNIRSNYLVGRGMPLTNGVDVNHPIVSSPHKPLPKGRGS